MPPPREDVLVDLEGPVVRILQRGALCRLRSFKGPVPRLYDGLMRRPRVMLHAALWHLFSSA